MCKGFLGFFYYHEGHEEHEGNLLRPTLDRGLKSKPRPLFFLRVLRGEKRF
jgi:hypothetical protein